MRVSTEFQINPHTFRQRLDNEFASLLGCPLLQAQEIICLVGKILLGEN
jgi:hypothetical protein